jgi:hypothetical protein
MSRKVAENFLFEFNDSRSVKEGIKVLNNILSFLQKKKQTIDDILTEMSSNNAFIRVIKTKQVVISAGEREITTRGTPTLIEVQAKPADIKEVIATWDTLVELNEVIDRYERSIAPSAESRYKNVPELKAVEAKVESFIKKTKESRDKLLKKLQSKVDTYMPRSLKVIVDKLKEELTTNLKGRFEECNVLYYPCVMPVNKVNVLAFYCYLSFTRLKDDDDWQHEVFDVVVISIPLADGTTKFQINTYEGHALPLEIPLEPNSWVGTVKGVTDRLYSTLTDVHALNLLKPQMLKVSDKDAKKTKDFKSNQEVAKLEVVDETFKIYLKPSYVKSEPQAHNVGKALWAKVVKFLLIDAKYKLSYKPTQEGTSWILNFKVSTPTQISGKIQSNIHFDSSAFKDFCVRQNLDGPQIRKVEEALKHAIYEKHKRSAFTQPDIITEKDDVKNRLNDSAIIPAKRTSVEKPETEKTAVRKIQPSMAPESKEKLTKEMIRQQTLNKRKFARQLEDEDVDI